MAAIFFLALCILIMNDAVALEVTTRIHGNIIFGAGYSEDSQQVVSQRCYNATVSSSSGQQNRIQLGVAISSSELEKELGISVSANSKIGLFSAEATANYLRSIQNKDASLSLNYYEYASKNIAVQIAGYGEGALTQSGKEFYKRGKNPYFGLFCGDQYISSYEQGALLTMGFNVQFSSSNEKRIFEEKAGASWGNIVSAGASIKVIAAENKITGSIKIQAFQIGGEPSQLSRILNKDSNGQYYVMACNLGAMDNCIKAANGLLNYAVDDFPNQFSFKNNTGLVSLGLGFTQYNPIKYIGLTPPVSLVTAKVVKYREDLSCRLKENEYYQQKLYSLLNGYPVKLDPIFLKNITSMWSKTKINVGILRQPHGGAVDCFNFPDSCEKTKARIDSQLQPFSTDFIENIKYMLTMNGGMAYSTGSSERYFRAAPFLANVPQSSELSSVLFMYSTEKDYGYRIRVRDIRSSSKKSYDVWFRSDTTVNTTDVNIEYQGILWYKGTNRWAKLRSQYYVEFRRISPFFFEPYKCMDMRD